MTSVDTAVRLGIDNMVLIMSAPTHMNSVLHEWLHNRAVPEHYIIDSTSRCERLTMEVQGRKTQAMFSLHEFQVRDIPTELLNSQAILLAPSFQEVGPRLLRHIRDSFSARIFWNPQLYHVTGNCDIRIGLPEESVHRMCSLADCVFMSLKESCLLTDQNDPLVAAEMLVEWGADIGVVTLGEKGAVLFDGHDFIITPSYGAMDISAADDIFAAAATTTMLNEKDLVDIASVASAVTSLVIEQRHVNQFSKRDIIQRAELIRPQIQVK